MKLDRATLMLLIAVGLARLDASRPAMLDTLTLLACLRAYWALARSRLQHVVRESVAARP